MSGRRTALRALTTCLAALFVALLLGRASESLILRIFRLPESPRFAVILRNFPRVLAAPSAPTLALGASAMLYDFSPREFDAAMRAQGIELRSYNLAVSGWGPLLLRRLAGRLSAMSKERGKRNFAALIEFAPPAATVSYNQDSVKLLAPIDLADAGLSILRDPSEGIESAGRIALSWPDPWGALMSRGSPINLAIDSFLSLAAGRMDASDRLAEKIDETHPATWLSLRGEQRYLYPETKEEYAAYRREAYSPATLESMLGELNELGEDFVDIRISERRVDDLVAAVRELQAVSDHVYVVLPPRNPEWNKPTPAALERVRRAVSEIRQRTGAEVLDYYVETPFTGADFVDVVHLNETSGRPKYSALLALDLARLLKRNRAARPF